VNNHAHVLKPQHQKIDPGYLFVSLEHKDIRQYLASGTRAKLNRSELNKVEVAVPRVPAEQRAIAEALSDADALIESLEALVAKKRQIKQGAMQELLTGKRRLPGFSGEWETRRVGSFGFTYGGLTGKSKVDFGHGDAVFVPFMNVMSHVQIDQGWMERVDVGLEERQNVVQAGDLLFNGSSETPEELGLCGVVLHASAVPRYLNSFCIGFRVTSEDVHPRYVARHFRGPVGREQMKVLAQGATRYNLSKRALCDLELSLPNLEEQVAIDSAFADLDSELEALDTKLEKARAIKQGMMQELLTGRTRLVPAVVS
jgi:type I restriction enzyme S subunit